MYYGVLPYTVRDHQQNGCCTKKKCFIVFILWITYILVWVGITCPTPEPEYWDSGSCNFTQNVWLIPTYDGPECCSKSDWWYLIITVSLMISYCLMFLCNLCVTVHSPPEEERVYLVQD